MLADRTQLQRWQSLLTVPPGHEWPDGPRIAADLRATLGRHRPWLTACLAAVDGIGLGATITFDAPLPSVPQRAPAAAGSSVADAVWHAYLLWRLGDAAADPWLRAFIATLDPTALVFTNEDNPEPWWQNEMLILHALHSFALRSRDGSVVEQTLACADFHLREIQPDHATNEPWSVHAYASHVDGVTTAESLWHAAHLQHGGVLGPVAVLLARDAAGSLAAWLSP